MTEHFTPDGGRGWQPGGSLPPVQPPAQPAPPTPYAASQPPAQPPSPYAASQPPAQQYPPQGVPQRPPAQPFAPAQPYAPAPAQPYAPAQPAAPARPAQTGPAQPAPGYGRPPAPAAPAQPAPGQPAPTRPDPVAEAAQAAAAAAAKAPSRERNSRVGLSSSLQEGDILLDDALRLMIELGASDLHLTTGSPPMVRLDGGLKALEGFPTVYGESLQRTLYSILSQRQREQFESELELDLAYAVRGVSRFRVNIYRQRDSIGAAFRAIPYEIRPLEALGVPPVVANFAGLPRGLVLVTGPTGSGKSTTLAAIIDLANRTRNDHIMTVEDPIEFLHRHKKCLVNQREVGADTHTFAAALKHVLRQDPDIILVGELRDLETIQIALTAAETGHLVFGTLHTQDAAQTIDRMIDVFPAHQQEQVRTQLAAALQGVVCQTLIKRANGRGRAVATEVLLATPGIRNLIREGKTHQIYSSMQAGAKEGMHTMDNHLADLVNAGLITYEAALEKAHHVEDFNRLVGRSSKMAQGAVVDQVAAQLAASEHALPPMPTLSSAPRSI